MARRRLTTRALNRAVLARQCLLGRSQQPPAKVLAQVAGIQMQYAPSGYIGLWSRMEGLSRDRLTTDLERRKVVQATLMRSTIHLVSARDYWPSVAGVAPHRRAWWERVSRSRRLDQLPYQKMADMIRRRLGAGPLRRSQLVSALEEEGYPKEAWEGVGLWVDLVRVPPSGTWERRRADLYGLAETCVDGGRPSEAEGLRHLLRRYLGAFGPAALADAANWAGVTVTALTPLAEDMRLRRFQDEEGTELLDLARAPLPDPDTPAPVRFLPTWDATLLVHARRAGILPERYRQEVFSTKNPQSVATFLVDGTVAGTWRHESDRIRLEPFEPLPPAVRRQLEEEARSLATFMA